MKRNTVNFLMDSALALVSFGLLVTGTLLWLVLPHGSRGRLLWGWGRHDWGDLHVWLAAFAVALLLIHLALHWQWICVTSWRCLGYGERRPMGAARRNMIGIASLLLLIGGLLSFIWIAGRAVTEVSSSRTSAATLRDATIGMRETNAGGWPRSNSSTFHTIRGSTTLGEAARVGSLSVEDVRARLHLPAGIPEETRIGHLVAGGYFSMREAREWLGLDHPNAPQAGRD